MEKMFKLPPGTKQDRYELWYSVIDKSAKIKNKKKWKNKERLIKKFLNNYHHYCSTELLELMYNIG